jgi:O-antigen ligase
MIEDKPLLGVGLASFGPAFPDYSTDQPREAHNTILQISAESGILAGMMYMFIVITCIVSLWKKGERHEPNSRGPAGRVLFIKEATLVGLCGLVACGMFLSLQVFEIFFLLNVLANAIVYLDRKSLAPDSVPTNLVTALAGHSGGRES